MVALQDALDVHTALGVEPIPDRERIEVRNDPPPMLDGRERGGPRAGKAQRLAQGGPHGVPVRDLGRRDAHASALAGHGERGLVAVEDRSTRRLDPEVLTVLLLGHRPPLGPLDDLDLARADAYGEREQEPHAQDHAAAPGVGASFDRPGHGVTSVGRKTCSEPSGMCMPRSAVATGTTLPRLSSTWIARSSSMRSARATET